MLPSVIMQSRSDVARRSVARRIAHRSRVMQAAGELAGEPDSNLLCLRCA